MVNVTLFVGPSGFGLDLTQLAFPGLRMHPPARRGDIAALLKASTSPGVIVLCDGMFQCQPAVSHHEICQALDSGWQVWGVSSIGAIRAREMLRQGMRGFGVVFEMFCQPGDFCDDEVCLLHFPEAPYFPVSEPLVNLRHALHCMGDAAGISGQTGNQLIHVMRERWFGDRSLDAMRQFLLLECGIEQTSVDTLFTWLVNNRIKALDLRQILLEQPWCKVLPGAN